MQKYDIGNISWSKESCKNKKYKTVIHSLFRLNKLCKRMRIQHWSDSQTDGILRLNRIDY